MTIINDSTEGNGNGASLGDRTTLLFSFTASAITTIQKQLKRLCGKTRFLLGVFCLSSDVKIFISSIFST